MAVAMKQAFKFGIEEEYFLVDAQTKSVARATPPGFWHALKDARHVIDVRNLFGFAALEPIKPTAARVVDGAICGEIEREQ